MAEKHSTPIGAKFNFLTVIEERPSRDWKRYALVRCDCGQEKELELNAVRYGATKSCGCIRRLKNPVPEIGARFGKLVVTGPFRTDRAQFVTCLCDCGSIYEAKSSFLKRGVAKSCGCLVGAPKHGHSAGGVRSRAHSIWTGMLVRCNPSRSENPEFARYSGRGIQVCDRWKIFENFLADMGEPPSRMSLDRFPDVNGDYEPGNCRWATSKEQANNTRSNRIIEFNNESLTLAGWTEKLNLPYPRTYYRLFVANWSIERAFTEPQRKKHRD